MMMRCVDGGVDDVDIDADGYDVGGGDDDTFVVSVVHVCIRVLQ